MTARRHPQKRTVHRVTSADADAIILWLRLSQRSAILRGHHVTFAYEGPSQSGIVRFGGGIRASCSCGWFSDCYAMHYDTERAMEAHLRRAKRNEFDEQFRKIEDSAKQGSTPSTPSQSRLKITRASTRKPKSPGRVRAPSARPQR